MAEPSPPARPAGAAPLTSAFLETTRIRKRDEVAARRRSVSAAALRDRATPTHRSLRAALAAPGARFLLENKRHAPSRGSLAPAARVADVLAAYRGVADGVSVLADAAFEGSLADIEEARRHTDLPVLCKDFVLGADQIVEARVAGADAALVILALVDDATARECLATAAALGMDVLVETHTAAELDRALALDALLIGINNRDLQSLTVDLAVTERLAPRVPAGVTLVTESGVGSATDVARLSPLVDAFLVGSAVMQAADRFDAARSLTVGRVKVCGLTRAEDARLAADLGARFGGLVFADSPRRVDRAKARAVADAVPDLPLVGVFRDQGEADVEAALAALPLAAVQLHGTSRELAAGLRRRLPPSVEVWAARGVTAQGELAPIDLGEGVVDRVIFDTQRSGRTGGTGTPFPWDAVSADKLERAVLAGGLAPGNARAARATGAYCLDVSSKLEMSPGAKDPALLRAFFDAVRPACRATQEASRAA